MGASELPSPNRDARERNPFCYCVSNHFSARAGPGVGVHTARSGLAVGLAAPAQVISDLPDGYKIAGQQLQALCVDPLCCRPLGS
jgi:hypothetical protein